MFVRYDYKAGSTFANLVSDVCSLLSGTTDSSTLSTDCVTGTTVIINDGIARPAGWELWDAAAETNGRAIRALNYDGLTYKYVKLAAHMTNKLQFRVYEYWNPTSHVGTNVGYFNTTLDCTFTVNLAAGGTIYISASARNITAIGMVSGTYDAFPALVAEHNRDEPWDTPALNIPPYGMAQNTIWDATPYGVFSKPRIRTNGGDSVNSNAVVHCTLPYITNNGNNSLALTSPKSKARDAGYNLVHAFCPITVSVSGGTGGSAEPQIFGKLFDVFVTTLNYGTSGDEVMFNGNSYFIIAGNTVRLAVPKY